MHLGSVRFQHFRRGKVLRAKHTSMEISERGENPNQGKVLETEGYLFHEIVTMDDHSILNCHSGLTSVDYETSSCGRLIRNWCQRFFGIVGN